MPASLVQYLRRDEIDEIKWNRCVVSHCNGLVYAMSLYLDAIAQNWDAIVINDYEAVFPLPRKKKMGIKYYYKPPFVQQLGIIGNVDEQCFPGIMNKIFKNVRYGDLLLNFSNGEFKNYLQAYDYVNMIIDLSEGYETISSRYRVDVKNNPKKAQREKLVYTHSKDINEAIGLYRHNVVSICAKDYARFISLCEELYKKQMVFIRKITSSEECTFSNSPVDKRR